MIVFQLVALTIIIKYVCCKGCGGGGGIIEVKQGTRFAVKGVEGEGE